MISTASRHLLNALSRLAAACLPLAASLCAAADPPAPVPPVPVPAQAVPAAPAIDDAFEAEPAGDSPDLFVTDRTAARRLRLAKERAARGDFDAAAELLQSVLDAEEDVAVPGDEPGTFRSVKRDALGVLGGLPATGREVYELKYGVAAKAGLAEAIRAGDWQAIEDVARRYFHSDAGYEATYRLAVRAQDAGEPLQAGPLFDRLVSDPVAARRFEPKLSLRAAAAWQAAGLAEAARKTAARAVAAGGNATLGGRTIAGTETVLNDLGRAAVPSRDAWPMFGGDFGRASDVGSVPVAKGPVWSHDFASATEWDDPRESARAARLAETLRSLEAAAGQTGDLTQPAFHPVTVGDVAVFRTLRNIEAVNLATGRFAWRTERPHDPWFAKATLDLTLEQGEWAPDLTEYVTQHAWRSTTTGTLSTDGRYVYGIQGAGRNSSMPASFRRLGAAYEPEPGTDPFNTLFAYDAAAEGAVAWTYGGPPKVPGTSGLFFLGPPLPLGGRLYALAEENAEVRLLVLDPTASEREERVAWSQTLVSAERAVDTDPFRRLSGLAPSFGDGVLVCPTGAGAVVGVDIAGRHLAWGYEYPRNIVFASPQGQNPFGNFQEPVVPDDGVVRWLDAVPRIAEGAVVLTPRDSDELHCLDAGDGRLRWKRPRGAGLFVAAVRGGKVVVAGRTEVEAFDLATGEAAWKRPIAVPTPAGQGVSDGDLYHLPLSTGEIMTLRISTGQVLGKSHYGSGVRVGNLIAAGGRLISQSSDALVGFPRRDELEAELLAALGDGDDPEALALRGEDRLHRGETDAGLADLRAASAAADLPRARRLLAGVLLDGLASDFETYRRYAEDLDRLTDDPRQRAEYLRRFGDGLRDAGEPAEALATYLKLLDDGVAGPLPETIEPGLTALSDRVLAARIADLHAAAAPRDRAAMDEILRGRLEKLSRPPQLERLWRFAMLAKTTPAATEALRRLEVRFEESGDRLRAERARRLLAETAGPLGDPLPAPPDAVDPVYDVSYRAEYVPDEINGRRAPTEVEPATPVRVVGRRPAELAGWRFELASGGSMVVARDATGRTRWQVPLGLSEDGAVPVSQPKVRFSGHLMALVVGTRLQAVDLLGDPRGPRLLWTRELLDPRGAPMLDRGYGTGDGGRPIGPAGFAGAELLVYQVGGTVVAADAVSGEPLWKRGGVPADCDVSGDRDFVLLQPAFGADAHVLRASDGVEVAVRHVPSVASPLGRVRSGNVVGWEGTRTVTWRKSPDGTRLACRDVARDRDVWSRGFSATALQRAVGAEELAVLDPKSGKLDLVRISDGETIFSAEAFPDKAVNQFVVMRAFGRHLLFTHRQDQPGRNPIDGGRTHLSADGLAYAFDGAGKRIWSAAIDSMLLELGQPTGLPVLVLTDRKRTRDDSNGVVALLDVRTGGFLANQTREQPELIFRTEGNPKDGSIVVSLPEATFRLTRIEKPLPPPRAETPDSLKPPGDAAAEPAVPVKLE